jgi:tRNA(adenine34) deaminase
MASMASWASLRARLFIAVRRILRVRRIECPGTIANTGRVLKLPSLSWLAVNGQMPSSDESYMREAIEFAERAAGHGDVPIGALVVRGDVVIGAAGNERELRGDPTAHAELLALREAAERLGGWRIEDASIYVTLEPCAMCAGAIVLARIARIVYGAPDPKAGAAGSVLDVLGEPALNHHPEVTRGVLAQECAALLSEFFGARR